MRRLALGLLCALLAACAPASGAEVEPCEAIWRSRDAQILTPGGAEERPVAIDCMGSIDRRRLRIGFTMPGGPDCYQLGRIDVVETADAVSVSLFLSRSDDPTAGACADGERRVRTELDLQAAVGSRTLLDGSR